MKLNNPISSHRKKKKYLIARTSCTSACSECSHTLRTSPGVWWKRNSSMIWQHWQSTVPKVISYTKFYHSLGRSGIYQYLLGYGRCYVFEQVDIWRHMVDPSWRFHCISSFGLLSIRKAEPHLTGSAFRSLCTIGPPAGWV